jgi:hypothetical protein
MIGFNIAPVVNNSSQTWLNGLTYRYLMPDQQTTASSKEDEKS